MVNAKNKVNKYYIHYEYYQRSDRQSKNQAIKL